MKKTILTTLAITMTLNSAAFASDKATANEKSDRILKVAAMTNEERQSLRQEVIERIESYKEGLQVLKKDIVKANDIRDEKSLRFLYSALASLGTGAIAYLSSTRNVKSLASGKSAGARIAAVVSLLSAGYAAAKGQQAIKAQIDVNRLQTEIDKSVKELELLQTELEAITDLTPKE